MRTGSDQMNYNVMVEEALRGVVRTALKHAEANGLPGNHHFYVSFRTQAEGVDIPDFLIERYPEEMTIVIQHQYWGLEVEDERFAVTLSFNKSQQRLTIPYSAVTAFADPSVQFGLQFKASVPAVAAPVKPPEQLHPEQLRPATGPSSEPTASPSATEESAPAERKGAEVVTLDAFRKK